jgi:hypothetical protein
MSSLVWTIHRTTITLTLRFPFRASAPSYLFQHVFWQDTWIPSCPNSIMFWLRGGCLGYKSTNLLKLSTNFLGLLHNISNMTWIAPSLNYRYPSMHVHTSINFKGIHLLRCVHGNKRTRTHDVVYDTFATITWDVSFHMGWKQLHVLVLNTFNFSH